MQVLREGRKADQEAFRRQVLHSFEAGGLEQFLEDHADLHRLHNIHDIVFNHMIDSGVDRDALGDRLHEVTEQMGEDGSLGEDAAATNRRDARDLGAGMGEDLYKTQAIAMGEAYALFKKGEFPPPD